MGFAVEAYYDPTTDERVRGLWEALARAGISDSMFAIGARPHISLAVFDDLDPDTLREEVAAFARNTPPLAVTLAAVGIFPGEEGVVYLAPVVTMELLELHARFHRRLRDLGLESAAYYCPGDWVPHCTVATGLPPDKVSLAVEACRSHDVFTTGQLTAVSLVEFRPVWEICVCPLGGEL